MISYFRYVRRSLRDVGKLIPISMNLTSQQRCGLCWHPSRVVFVCLLIGIFYILIIWDGFLPSQKVHNPTPMSSSPLYPSPASLLNLMDFTYIINNDVCGRNDVFVTVIIHTHPANRERRDIMRKHIPSSDLMDMGMRRVFLLARAEWNDQQHYKKTPQEYIDEENLIHKDIIQGNFKEHYHNLTYKHIMGLQWVTRYCPTSKYLIKMDDDIVVDLYQFRDRLKSRYSEKKNLILGLLQPDSRPVRNKKSKWDVSETEFAGEFYAPFVSGWAYAMALDAAEAIVEEAPKLPYFWIDDVHITGTLAERAKVKREGLNQFYTLHVEHLHCCVEQADSNDFFCDYLAGPSEGDFEIMGRVLSHARSCYVNPCMRRTLKTSISRTCVVAKVPPYAPLGMGHGEIVKVYG